MHVVKRDSGVVEEPLWAIPERLRLDLLAHLARDPTFVPTMSYEEFLDWADEDTLAEWVEGRVVMTSPANRVHQDLARFLGELLGTYVETHALGDVLIAPFQMKLPTSGREPDVIFVAAEHRDRLLKARVEGAADLVVEIVSEESKVRDRGEKFYEYQAGGVREYWLIEPDARRADFFQLDADGLFEPVLPDRDGIYHARALPGFWLRVEWLWQRPHPPINRVMLAVDGGAYAQRMMAELRESGHLPR